MKFGTQGKLWIIYGISLTSKCWKVFLESHFIRVIRCTSLKMASYLKTARRSCRAKRIESWEPGVIVKGIVGTFDLLVFKVIWGSFGALVLK